MNAAPVGSFETPVRGTLRTGRRILFIVLGVMLLLAGLYAAAGYLWAPRLIEQQAKAWARDNLKQELALGEVKVDPFGLSVDISGIAIPAGNPMVSVRHLHLNLAARSLLSESYRFDEIRVEGPQVKAIVEPDGKLNLLKLVPPPNPEPLPNVLIAGLKVVDGAAYLADWSKPNRPDTRLTLSRFELQNLHTTRDEGGNLNLNGVSDEGEAFAWKGKISMAPIASSGTLTVRNLQASSVQKFAGELLPSDLRAGSINVDASYAASYDKGGTSLGVDVPLLRLAGLRVEGRPALIHADARIGGLAVAGTRIRVTIPAGSEIQSVVSVDSVAVRNLLVDGTGPAKGESARLASAAVDGISVLPENKGFAIGTIRLSGLDAATSRAPDGGMGLMRLMPVSRGASEGGPPSAIPHIGAFSLTDAKLRLVDRAVRPTIVWTITPLTVSAQGKGLNGPLKISTSGRLNGATSFSASGDVNPAPFSADLAVKMAHFPVKAAVPYTIDFPALQIVSGTASADGRVRYGPKVAGYTGAVSIDDLKLIETYQKSDLVAWKRLHLTGIDANPRRVTVERATLKAPYATVIILQDGTLNFQRLVTMNPQPIVTPAVDAPPPPKLNRAQRREATRLADEERAAIAVKARAALAAPLVEPAVPVLVKRLEIEGGTMDFADYSLRPNFAAKVQGVDGSIANISNSPRALSRVKLDGYVMDKYSPVTIAGEVTPLQYDRRTQMDLAFRNIELPVFNPYSGRFAGYSIAKGKLTTELSYSIDNRALDAKHHIIIDQLEWGEATDSKEKVSLPLKFATSLMKDRNGVIDLDVPVTGTLDDPEFKLGPIIWKVVGNLLTKVLTAPFSALGDLFGGKEDVQFIDFSPGSATLPRDVTSNLAGIAKGLSEKAELRLEIPAGPGLPMDATGIADSKIATAAMAKEAKKGQPADLAALELDKRHDRLKDLYKARFKTGAKFAEGPEGETKDDRRTREVEWLTAELRQSFAPTPAELAALGKARAEAVRLALLEGGTAVDPARLFLSSRDSAVEKDGKARMELKLEGS